MSTFPFPLSSPDDLIMDRNGITGQSNSPVSLRRRRGAMGDPGFDPSLDQPSTSSPTTTDYDSVPSAPSSSSHSATGGGGGGGGDDFSSPIDTGYSNLTSLTQDPRRQPKSKGVLREILGGVAALHPLTRQFSDDITYGRQAAHDQQDWRQDMGLALQRAKVGEEELGHLGTLGYHRSIAGMRADQNRINEEDKKTRGYNAQMGALSKRGAREESDAYLDSSTPLAGTSISIPSRVTRPDWSTAQEPDNPLTGEKGQRVSIPPRSVLLHEQELSKGGEVDPLTLDYIKANLESLDDPGLKSLGQQVVAEGAGAKTPTQLRLIQHMVDKLTGLTRQKMVDSQGKVISNGGMLAIPGRAPIVNNIPRRSVNTTTSTTAADHATRDTQASDLYSTIDHGQPYDQLVQDITNHSGVKDAGLTSEVLAKAKPRKPSGTGTGKKAKGMEALQGMVNVPAGTTGHTPTTPASNTTNMMRVRNKQTGQTGQLPAKNFDPNKYEQLSN